MEAETQVKGTNVSKGIWLLAIAPLPIAFAGWLIELYMESTFSGTGYGYEGHAARLTVLAGAAINYAFIYLDVKWLEGRIGSQISTVLKWVGVIVVPAYLVIRALKYKGGWAPLIVWVITFVLSIFI